MMSEFDEMFKRMDRVHADRKDEFEKLRLDQSAIDAEEGDTVVVSAGPLGMGFDWVRLEAVVVRKGQQSLKVRFTDYKHALSDEPVVMWIHPALVTDVIKAQGETGVNHENNEP